MWRLRLEIALGKREHEDHVVLYLHTHACTHARTQAGRHMHRRVRAMRSRNKDNERIYLTLKLA